MRKSLIIGALVLGFAATAHGNPSVIQPAVKAWVAAAKTGRADMWLVGDSISNNFDAGLSKAASQYLGLAGTGLGSDIGGGVTLAGTPSFTISPPYPLNSNGWDTSRAAVRADRQSYVLPFGEPATAGAAAAQYDSFYLNPGTYLDPQAAYDWHLWTTSPDTGGSMTGVRSLKQSPNTVFQTLPTTPTAANPSGLQHSVLSFNALSGPGGSSTGGDLTNVTNTSILYSRLLRPGATGATLTTWSYGGHTTLDMIQDKLGSMSPAGVAQYLTAMTDAGSGKLMVTIEEGNNDHGQSAMSIRGVAPSNTGSGFNDNLTYLMDEIRSDWSLAGKAPANLSFLLLGMYEKNLLDDQAGNAFMRGNAQIMHDVAAASTDTSFIDLHDIAPSWQTAFGLGYMADDIHPTILGADTYSAALMAQLVPEPAATMLLLPLAALARRRRSTRSNR